MGFRAGCGAGAQEGGGGEVDLADDAVVAERDDGDGCEVVEVDVAVAGFLQQALRLDELLVLDVDLLLLDAEVVEDLGEIMRFARAAGVVVGAGVRAGLHALCWGRPSRSGWTFRRLAMPPVPREVGPDFLPAMGGRRKLVLCAVGVGGGTVKIAIIEMKSGHLPGARSFRRFRHRATAVAAVEQGQHGAVDAVVEVLVRADAQQVDACRRGRGTSRSWTVTVSIASRDQLLEVAGSRCWA